ncbi:hypothetical protein [Caballeronia novacaledonica]|uniref:hypothetical protein n=1 Tax=Caballeronia novacaledonica TaxID=1544861 RepID=UPI001FE5AD58|nr:hypothetical protein [Caballeronia novacaledonica]
MLRVLVGVLATRMVWTLGVVDCATVGLADEDKGALAGAAALAVAGVAELSLEPPPPQA